MSRDIDQLTDALQRAYPGIIVERVRVAHPGADEEEAWQINHPAGMTQVQVESATGTTPFVVQSDLAPPTLARTVDQATRLVIERLGLRIGTA
jgi:hypothetical protein